MIAQDNPQDEFTFRVVYSESVRHGLKELCKKAKRYGLGQIIFESIKRIDEQLHDSPLQFGEPVFRLKKAKATLRIIV